MAKKLRKMAFGPDYGTSRDGEWGKSRREAPATHRIRPGQLPAPQHCEGSQQECCGGNDGQSSPGALYRNVLYEYLAAFVQPLEDQPLVKALFRFWAASILILNATA